MLWHKKLYHENKYFIALDRANCYVNKTVNYRVSLKYINIQKQKKYGKYNKHLLTVFKEKRS